MHRISIFEEKTPINHDDEKTLEGFVSVASYDNYREFMVPINQDEKKLSEELLPKATQQDNSRIELETIIQLLNEGLENTPSFDESRGNQLRCNVGIRFLAVIFTLVASGIAQGQLQADASNVRVYGSNQTCLSAIEGINSGSCNDFPFPCDKICNDSLIKSIRIPLIILLFILLGETAKKIYNVTNEQNYYGSPSVRRWKGDWFKNDTKKKISKYLKDNKIEFSEDTKIVELIELVKDHHYLNNSFQHINKAIAESVPCLPDVLSSLTTEYVLGPKQKMFSSTSTAEDKYDHPLALRP